MKMTAVNSIAIAPSPQITSVERIKIIDVLRGFALLGIIIVHVVEQYYAGDSSIFAKNTPLDMGISIFMGIFIIGKFFPIFSFLFGLSFAIQMNQAKEKGKKYTGRFLWRLVILLGIGAVHQAFYRGDILMLYAILGLVLLICQYFNDKILLILSLALVLNVVGFVERSIEVGKSIFVSSSQAQTMQSQESNPAPQTEVEDYQKANKAYFDLIKTGSWWAIAKQNLLGELDDKINFQIGSGRIWLTMGLFILGLYVGRKRIFENLVEHLPLVRRIFKYCAWSIVVSLLIVAIVMGIYRGNPPPAPWLMLLGGTIFDAANVTLPFLYITGVILLFQKVKWEKILLCLYPVGRMGLTTYVMQAVIGTFIFYGYGLNLIGKLGNASLLLMALGIYAMQIVFSRWWLSRFHYGILEWLWRSATYLQWQELKKK
ncbi:DUF418 domain-containing protein [Thermoflexibacter ruber]|uniref:DUF418 domain-containing protein n=1 Tax=Thermoflexibacter ruber TaxID=1003 RepID=A0A1I2AEK9_9BACT|nr:DUF418 domain-containing protein [Thermoflexibacter ruber]SFE42229.1 uncharacterized protein SAMN04488541_1001136 [Thermoflexibacter ruber]